MDIERSFRNGSRARARLLRWYIKQVTHDSFVETDTNSMGRFSLRASGPRTETLDFVAAIRTVVGEDFLMTAVCGGGDVIHDAGRVVFDAPFHVSFEAGRHDCASRRRRRTRL